MTDPKALIPVRSGVTPIGSVETVAEAAGRCWLIGSGCREAVEELAGTAVEVQLSEIGEFLPHRWAPALAPAVAGEGHLLLPHSADGRDLAPLLAVALDRPLVSAATRIGAERAVVAGDGGLTMTTLALDRPVVATFQLDARTPPPRHEDLSPSIVDVSLTLPPDNGELALLEEIPADPATIDLAEANRIVAAGVGIGDESVVADVEAVAALLGASVGATRVITDWGWLPAERQIGTTGVTVDPELYLAVGISGAVQHTAGLGDPDHIIVVNTDPSCPMMTLADLALVCDGPAFLAALRERLTLVSP